MFGHGEDTSVDVSSDYFGAKEAFDSLVHVMRKNTGAAINKNQAFFNSITNVNKIYSYGFSFSDVDMCYLDEISRRIIPKNVRWYFNSYDWQNNKEYISKVKSYGYKIRKCYWW